MISARVKTFFSQDSLHFILLFCLFFLASFVYNILLPLKKTVIMYIPGAGSESMVYLKPFFITPGSILLTSIFLVLSSRFNTKQVFRGILALFTAYFFLYRFLFAPYRIFFSATMLASFLGSMLPQNFHAAPPLIEYWMDAIFYTMADLWGTTFVSLMIWGVVNQNITQEQAQSRYGFFTIGANSSAIVAGWLSSAIGQNFFIWEDLFNSILNIALLGCLLIGILYEILIAQGWLSESSIELSLKKSYSNPKSFSLFGSFQHVYRHQRLWAIAIIVIAYNTLYTLSEFLFMKQIELHFNIHDKIQSNVFISQVAMSSGICATIFALILYPLATKFGGWLWPALFTPLCFVFTALLFYGSQYFPMSIELFFYGFSLSTPLVAGAAHVALLRGARYSLFDATKESAYVGLPKADQIQGKAAIDSIGSRLGRSLGSFVFFFLFAICGNSMIATLPYITIIVAFTSICWIHSIFILNDIRQKDLKESFSLSADLQLA